jgi:hypothetical protein
MKTETFTLCNGLCRALSFKCLVLLLCAQLIYAREVKGQCSSGYSEVTLNWEYLDFFVYSGEYDNGYLPSVAAAQTQHFAFGTQRLTITNNYSSFNIFGDNDNHSGETGSYGTGPDIEFRGNGQIVLEFENEVNNLRFSMYDVDRNQDVSFDARDAANNPLNLTLATLGSTIITINNNNTPSANADAANSSENSSSLDATFNVDIAGPVKRVTINISNTNTSTSENGSFWISDLTACSAGTFPLNYFEVARPFTGQPGYVLHAFDKDIYALDPATGNTKYLFTDPDILGDPDDENNRCTINSMGYDPYNRILYYVFSLSADPGNNRQLRKYDFNTETITVLLNDVNAIGIPTSTIRGVESGAAAFYNGSLYLGIETVNSNRRSNRENVVYRVDFDGSNIPYRASQVYAVPCDNGSGTLMNDWADFTINDGALVNFDGAGVTTQSDVYHYNMLTGEGTVYHQPGWTPGQPTVDWQGIFYQVHARGSAELPHVAVYNEDGTIGTAHSIVSNPMYSPESPSLGDAAEAFRPKSDFGDAPASYDPDPMAPATHELDNNLRLGSTITREWSLTSSSLADAEGGEEDGIGSAPILDYDASLTYTVNNITVYNNTGVNATLAGWLDYNYDGVFDAGEGVTITVPSNASPQTVSLNWNNIWVQATSNFRTFLRLRLTRASNNMTTASMNGWFNDGEVEDYDVPIGSPLPKDLQSFTVKKENNTGVNTAWSINIQKPVSHFEVLRSNNDNDWVKIGTVAAREGSGLQQYSFDDANPVAGTSYYRIKLIYDAPGSNKFSESRSVNFDINNNLLVRVLPNPANEQAAIQVNATAKGNAVIRVYDRWGHMVMRLKRSVHAGANTIYLTNLSTLAEGVYIINTTINGLSGSSKLIIKK